MSKKITLEGLDHFKDKENAMIAGKPESTNTATVAHAVGEYFYWKGVLYIVTAAIAVGGTIQTNTNVKPAVLADDVSDLKESVNQIGPTVYASFEQKTITDVPIASFDDGANDVPVKKLVVNVDPVQDLHGYDHPWPAGGGKNRFNKDAIQASNSVSVLQITDGFTLGVLSNGTYKSAANFRIDGNFSNVTIYLSGNITNSSTNNGRFSVRPYNSADSEIVGNRIEISESNNGQVRYGTLPAETAYLIIVIYATFDSNGSVGDTVTFKNVMLADENVSYTPYSNICPITGWTKADVFKSGKNILPKFTGQTTGGITLNVSEDGTCAFNGTSTSSVRFRTSYFLLKRGTYTLSCKNSTVFPSIGNAYLQILAEDGVQIAICSFNIANRKETFTVQTDIKVQASFRFESGLTLNNLILKPQCETGNTETSYEPYQSTTYSITFPSEAGTVYGGTLDVTNGTLTVDMAMVDLGTLAWRSSGPGGFFYTKLGALQTEYNYDAICSNYPKNTQIEPVEKTWQNNAFVGAGFNLIIKDTSYLEVSTFQNAMSGVQFAYKVSNPRTYSIAPQEVATLLGTNNIWADTGDIAELTYRAMNNTSAMIKLTKALIAPVLDSMVADTALAVNDFRIVGDTLYKVTAPIASGGTLTVGTNVAATTVGEQIKALLNA